MKSLILTLLLLPLVVLGYPNTPPIPDRLPGWSEGGGRLMIEFDLMTDLLCDGCADLHAQFQEFFQNMTYLGRPVKDQVRVNYGFLPLPYHHASWIPHRLMIYVENQCRSKPTKCVFNHYVKYASDLRDTFLNGIDQSYDQLTQWWIGQTSQRFGWPVADLEAAYNRTTPDAIQSETKSRWALKYAMAKGVFGTPTIFVNGIRLQNNPENATQWIQLLDDVYRSQPVKMQLWD